MPATYEDLVALHLPEWEIGEIVAGALHVRRLPPPIGTLAHSALLGSLRDVALRGPWRILRRIELCLGSDVLVPDLSGWRRERMQLIPKEPPWIELPPDWVCDVLTEGSSAVVRREKPAAYACHGIRWWWIVDPLQQTVEVCANEDGWKTIAVHGENEVVRIAPFEQIDIELALLWGAPPA